MKQCFGCSLFGFNCQPDGIDCFVRRLSTPQLLHPCCVIGFKETIIGVEQCFLTYCRKRGWAKYLQVFYWYVSLILRIEQLRFLGKPRQIHFSENPKNESEMMISVIEKQKIDLKILRSSWKKMFEKYFHFMKRILNCWRLNNSVKTERL